MSTSKPIISILCIGFHHKKGCQVEFSYPTLIESGKNEFTGTWKYLSSLALPDGSHNFTEDTVFFNIPSLHDPNISYYGISCYRQIPVEKLKNRTADITRSTVQKSVCVISTFPIYGYIEVKLSLIADAFFDQGDFSNTDILVKAYEQLNSCLMIPELNPLRHFHVGLSLRETVLKWRHKVLILYKLFLLQKRVVLFGSPVRETCALIIGISSLFPRLIEKGFEHVACIDTTMITTPRTEKNIANTVNTEIRNDIENEDGSNSEEFKENKLEDSLTDSSIDSGKEAEEFLRKNSFDEIRKNLPPLDHLQRDASADTLSSTLFPLASINPDSYNAPIPIFSEGNLCCPYLSLPFLDLLSDPAVHSYIIGTSNYLFQQKKNLSDIQVDVENANLEVIDQELKKQLQLTTEDLRFVDYILKNVQNPKENAEGSENWVRDMFQGYTLALIKTTVFPTKDCDHFNGHFITAFKKTQCFNDWYESKPDDEFFDVLASGHPFSGTLSIADMKLRFNQTIQSTESGRKIQQTVNTTSRAISQAKGAIFKMGSNLWSSMTTTAIPVVNLNENFTDNQNEIEGENLRINLEEPNVNINTNVMEKIESCQEIHEIENSNQLTNNKPDGIVEVAKEAELLNKNNIFTV